MQKKHSIKIQQPIHDQNSKLGIDGKFLNLIKNIKNLQLMLFLMVKNYKVSPEDQEQTRTSPPTTPFNIILEVPANAIRQEKDIKGIQIEKEEIKLSLFTDDVIIYVENPKEWTKKLLELISKCGKDAGHKLIYQSQSFSYTPTMKKWNLKLKTHYHLF